MLYYILVKRLLKQQPTILQNDPGHLFLFNAKGVKAVSSSNRVFPGSSEYENMWALVDIDPDIQKPARMVCHETSPFFLVMASSPRPSRLRELQKHGQPGAYWLMKPFTLEELIQALVLLTQNFVFGHLCDITVANFSGFTTTSQTLRTSSRSTGRQPVIVTISARPTLSINTLATSAPKSKQ